MRKVPAQTRAVRRCAREVRVKNQTRVAFLCCMMMAAAACSPVPEAAHAIATPETHYLAFQVFTGSPNPHVPIGGSPSLDAPPTRSQLDAFAADVIDQVGLTGNADRRLALIFGPVALDQTDAQIAALTTAAFDIALARDVAVGFHLDDSIFWSRRHALFSDPGNIERGDWDGPLSTGRRLDWGPEASRGPPQMCINSPAVEAEARRLGTQIIGTALRNGLERLRRAGREDLFAGMIVGWETQIGRDFGTGRALGYCVLANRGLRRGAARAAMDQARVEAVDRFISIWSQAIASAGVPSSRIYSHVAFFPRHQFDADKAGRGESYAERTNFSPAEIAFGPGRRAGFSTYPQPETMEEIYDQTARAGGAPWASSEGANLTPGGGLTDSGMSMETYLARLFNHGAVLVNVFGWGIGPADNGFRQAAQNTEAIAAYRKFLRGAALVEGPVTANILERLPTKIHRIQAELPAWVRGHNGQARATAYRCAPGRARPQRSRRCGSGSQCAIGLVGRGMTRILPGSPNGLIVWTASLAAPRAQASFLALAGAGSYRRGGLARFYGSKSIGGVCSFRHRWADNSEPGP